MLPRREPERNKGIHRPTALVVEPVPAMAKLLKAMMGDLGFSVICASTPAEALTEVESREFDIHVVVSEFSMPEVSGARLASFVSQQRPDVPVLLLCDQNPPQPSPGTASPAFLEKPFTQRQLAEAIKRLRVSVS